MISRSSDRVAINTDQEINDCIQRQIEANIERYSRMGNRAIAQRLEELDAEWDIERILETMAPVITLTTLCLGATVNKRWLLLSLAVQGFFLQHAIQGWCPPIPVLRRLGVRTTQEINRERVALKALRGDFDRIASDAGGSGVQRAINAAMA